MFNILVWFQPFFLTLVISGRNFALSKACHLLYSLLSNIYVLKLYIISCNLQFLCMKSDLKEYVSSKQFTADKFPSESTMLVIYKMIVITYEYLSKPKCLLCNNYVKNNTNANIGWWKCKCRSNHNWRDYYANSVRYFYIVPYLTTS